jgi:selenocysteine-specific elongation factor
VHQLATPSAVKSIIVGTAGHIDHGKSALVEALTGTHPDRLEEEKRRGITLDLGFAFLDLGDVQVGFVDVPGHERFVRNMLAGAGGFDLVLLVVAADESIKPQTREHFEICRLLGISQGIVALTKCDLVGRDALDLARLEVEEFVRGSFLANAPVVATSVKTGQGLGELRRELARMADGTPPKDSSRYFRLPIDRAFAIKGFGTVVTGTLVSGEVRPAEAAELLPSKRRVRIRGVQSGGQALLCARAGQRTALNLAGVDLSEVCRGMVLAAPGRFEPTVQIDARITLLPSAQRLKLRSRVHFHQGTVETVATVYPLGGGEIAPGSSALAQLRLAEPVLVLPKDRFILRQLTPLATIGGGVVIDPLPAQHRARDKDAADFVAALERHSADDHSQRQEALAILAAAAPAGMTLAGLVARTGWLEEEVRGAAESLEAAGRMRIVSQQPLLVASPAVVAASGQRMVSHVERFHRLNPLVQGIVKEELRTRTASAVPVELFRAALDDLISMGRLAVDGDLLRVPGRAIKLQPEEARASGQIEAEFARAGLTAPAVNEVLAKLGVEPRRAQRLLQLLLRDATLVRVSNDLVFHRAALERLRKLLAEYKRTRGERLTIGAFKELAGVSRKYAIPLLEYLDRAQVTRRLGDDRAIL